MVFSHFAEKQVMVTHACMSEVVVLYNKHQQHGRYAFGNIVCY